MIPLKMLIVLGLVLVLRSSTASADGGCLMADNTTVADGTELFNSGCRREVCQNGTVVKEKVCPPGFTLVNYGGQRTTCLMFIKRRMDWATAHGECSQYKQDEEGIGEAGLFEAPKDDKFNEVKMYGNQCADLFLPSSPTTTTPQPTSSYKLSSYRAASGAIRIEPPLNNLDHHEASFRVSAEAMSPCQGEFTCENGDCAVGKACDGTPTCADESDEKYCIGPCDFWAGADNSDTVSEVEWKSSGKKVEGVMTNQADMCLAIVDGEKKLVNCKFEGLYPMCEVCSAKGKVEPGCQYNKKVVKEGKVADNDDCSTKYCRNGKIETEPKCPGAFTYISEGELEGCYLLFKHEYTRQAARDRCEQLLDGMQNTGKALKRLASRATAGELDLIGKFLDENLSAEAATKYVWLDFEEQKDVCSYIKDGEMNIAENVTACDNMRANSLCEACYSEGDQKDSAEEEPETEGCLYKKTQFEVGAETEPDTKDCYAIVCEGNDKWVNKHYGPRCCQSEDGALWKEGDKLEGDKPVREAPEDVCVRVMCDNRNITTTPMKCGCKGDLGETYTDGHVVSSDNDPEVCEKKVCEDGTINTYPLPSKDCEPPKPTGCTSGSKKLKTNEQTCTWTNKKKKQCKVGTCQSNGSIKYANKKNKGCNKC